MEVVIPKHQHTNAFCNCDCLFLCDFFCFPSCRVERLWRDVWMAVTSVYYELLHSLEEDELLDPSNSLHLFCAQYVFVPRLRMDLDTFTGAWDNHPLRTEQNLTPNQLWTLGLLQTPVAAPENLEVKAQQC